MRYTAHQPSTFVPTSTLRKGVCSILRLKCAPVQYLFYPVHGSLARAGKVKSQTPKVKKQDKEKAPTGRAKKCELYNRRQVPSNLSRNTGR